MAVGISEISRGVFAGIVSGILIVALRFPGDIGLSPLVALRDMLDAAGIENYTVGLGIILACLLSGFLVVALMPRSTPLRHLCPILIVSGFVACIVNIMFFSGDLLSLGRELFTVEDLIELSGVSIAGGAIAYAFLHRNGSTTADAWGISLLAGVAVAILMSVTYSLLFLMYEAGLFPGIVTQSLFYHFFEEITFVIAGAFAGITVAMLISRRVSRPSHLVLQIGLSGAIAGLISALFATWLATTSYSVDVFRPFSHSFLPYDASFVIYRVVQLALLAIAGGMLYFSLYGEPSTAVPGSTDSAK